MNRNPLIVLIYAMAGLVLLLIALSIVCAVPKDASAGTWVNIDQFRGLATHTNAVSDDPSIARYIDGWFVRNGALEKPWYQKISSSPVSTSPVYILGQNASSDHVLLFTSDNFFSMKNDTIDPVGYAQTARPDSAYTLSATDSILYSWEDGNGTMVDTTYRDTSSWWLPWVLTTRPSVVWDSATITVRGFYSNRWLLTGVTTQTVQTRPLGLPVSTPSVSEGSGTLELPVDTTLIFDGTYIWVYSGDADSILNSSTTTFNLPKYADTGRVINTYESGDSLIMVIDPPDSVYTQANEFWILWDDSLLTSHATPDSIISAIEYSTDSMRCIILADTTKYKGVNHYWGRQNGSGARHMMYLLYKPGAATQRARLGSTVANSSHDSLTYLGKVGPLHYALFHTHGQDGSGVQDLDGFNTRSTDRNVWQLSTDAGALNSDDDSAFCLLTGYSTSSPYGSSFRYFSFLLWDTDTIKVTEWCNGTGGGNAINSLFYRPQIGAYNATTNPKGWAITTVSTSTSNDRFAVLGRQRSWSSGNTHINSTTGVRDSTTNIRYSRLIGKTPGDTVARAGNAVINFMVFPAENKFQLEGYDPITGLSMLGQTLAIYRRRGITLLTGFAPGEFYTQPAPVGQGAANHWCIARDPLKNEDVITNENGIFSFSGSGLEDLAPNIIEVLSDSVNWDAENKLRAAAYDNMYFVSVPIDTHTTNNRVIGLDLESKDPWLISRPRVASVWNFKDDDGSEDLYFGDADSSVVWKVGGSTSNLFFTPDWKSSWTDLGDPQIEKRVVRQRIEIDPGHYTDTIFVDWYKDLRDTIVQSDSIVSSPLWTDTIPVATSVNNLNNQYPNANGSDYPAGAAAWQSARNIARGQDVRRQTIQREVPARVSGKFLSFGIRCRSVAVDFCRVMRFGFEYVDLGRRVR